IRSVDGVVDDELIVAPITAVVSYVEARADIHRHLRELATNHVISAPYRLDLRLCLGCIFRRRVRSDVGDVADDEEARGGACRGIVREECSLTDLDADYGWTADMDARFAADDDSTM